MLFCMRCFVLIIALLAAVATPAQAAPDSASTSTSCGSTVAESLTQARTALARHDAASDHTAISCLLGAISMLDAKQLTATRSDGNPVLSMPGYAAPVK